DTEQATVLERTDRALAAVDLEELLPRHLVASRSPRHWQTAILQAVEQDEVGWSLGYGIGSSIKLGPRFLLNLEAISSHVNEREGWTSELNQLNQFKVLFDGRFGRKTSLFVGPTLNQMISEIFDPETGEYGTTIAPRPFSDKTKGTRNTKWWIGFNAGLRF
ncbi:MAG: hypothetical protein AAF242_16160, partial [Bacteroidota bacterium]